MSKRTLPEVPRLLLGVSSLDQPVRTTRDRQLEVASRFKEPESLAVALVKGVSAGAQGVIGFSQVGAGAFSEADLQLAMIALAAAFLHKGEEFAAFIKMGRTQLQDAVPMTLGQEFNAFAHTMLEDVDRLGEAQALIREINMGATAIGTGICSPPGYADLVTVRLVEASGLPLHEDNQTIVKERIYFDKARDRIIDEITTIDHALTRPWTVIKPYMREKLGVPWIDLVCNENNPHVVIGGQNYFLSYDGYLMPARKNQEPPDLRYFNQVRR